MKSETVSHAADPVVLPESVAVALAFGASCWLFDTFLTTSLAGTPIREALLPSGDALALRIVVSLLVAIAAGITSTFVIRELKMRREPGEIEKLPESDILESFSECAFAVNHDGEIIDANQAAARLFSWPVNMFMPMKLDWLISEYIADDVKISSFAELVREDSGPCKNNGSVVVIGKALTGRKFVADLSCMPARDQDRRFIVFVRERLDAETRRSDEATAVE